MRMNLRKHLFGSVVLACLCRSAASQSLVYDDFTNLAGNSTQPTRFSPDPTLGDFTLSSLGKHLKLAFAQGTVDDTVLWSPDYSGAPLSSPGRYLVLRYKLTADSGATGDGSIEMSIQWTSSQGGPFEDGNVRKRYWYVPAVAGWHTVIVDLADPDATPGDRNLKPSYAPSGFEDWGASPLQRFVFRVGWTYGGDDEQYIDGGAATCLFDLIALVDDYESFQKQAFADYFMGLRDRKTTPQSGPGVWQYFFPPGDVGGTSERLIHWAGDTYDSADRKENVGVYTPLIGAYDTNDPDVQEYHMLLAKIAGLDGFLCEWQWTELATQTGCTLPSGTPNWNTQAIMNFAQLAEAHDFEIGVNWAQESAYHWMNAPPHSDFIARLQSDFRYILETVYDVNGAKVKGRPLVLNWSSGPNGGTCGTCIPSYLNGPGIQSLRDAAEACGWSPIMLARPNYDGVVPTDFANYVQYVDGFFGWHMVFKADSDDDYWSFVNLQSDELAYLDNLYTGSIALMDQGKIQVHMGSATPRFDDHKGESWASATPGIHIPYYDASTGQTTLEAMLDELPGSEADLALLVTWNDHEEGHEIEPTREFGYAEIEETARQIHAWKWGETFTGEALLRLPERLFRVRKALKLLVAAGYSTGDLGTVTTDANEAAAAIEAGNQSLATSELVAAEEGAESLVAGLVSVPIDLTCDFDNRCGSGLALSVCPNFAPIFIEPPAGQNGFTLEPSVNFNITSTDLAGTGTFIGTLTVEYYDADRGRLQVLLAGNQEIAAFPMQASQVWRKSQIDLIGLQLGTTEGNSVDLTIKNLAASTGQLGAVHGIRIEGRVVRKP